MMMLTRWLPLCVLLLPTFCRGDESAELQFNRDIRPILSDNCFHCHGPDKAQRQAELRLDREEDVFADREGTKILVPGKPHDSELYRRIVSQEESERMPPVDSGRELSKQEIDVLKRWIEQGAKWQPHWSLIAPTSPQIPEVKNTAWPRNPIDRFLLHRLESERLSPSPEAERTTLIRRVTLDLTGLPPTPEEVEAFLSDTEPGAYERLVDRLLASPRYGERMAMDWLDAARYADTSGYQNDGPRDMWRWRDWVIDSFNAHQPYDQFTVEQLAGDLLPHATLSQKIATGFNRNHRGNAEGGIIPEEYACEYVVDRVETTFTVWMGLTMGCARCHDHKFDPLTQTEFYQAFAFFNNIPEYGRAIKEGNSPPFLKAPPEEQDQQLQTLMQEYQQAVRKQTEIHDEVEKRQREWEQSLLNPKEKTPLQWFPREGLVAHFPFDEDAANHATAIKEQPPAANIDIQPGLLDGCVKFVGNGFEAGPIANFGYFDKFSFSFWIKPEQPTGTILSKMKDEARADGYALRLENGKLQVNLVKRWLDDAIRVETVEPLKLNEWQHVVVTYDGSRLAAGIRIYIDGRVPAKKKVQLDFINQSFASEEPFRIGQGGGPDSGFHGQLDELRIYDICLPSKDAFLLNVKESLTDLVALPRDRRDWLQHRKLTRYFIENIAPETMRTIFQRPDKLIRQADELYESFPTVMVMQENATPTKTYVLNRGQYDQPGEEVQRNVPECLPPFPSNQPGNRLGFARWLVDPRHPLTARVAVNRLWQLSFGTGLVKTAEDFGSQGERPSHPELLDWLAVELVKRNWDMQAIQRLIVTSAAYRQSSRVSPALLQRDPGNRLLARGPRFRMSAGMIRDQALAASGLLAERLGGPSVKPYQPDGLWTELANEKPYQHDHGESLYRRSLYTYWKRTIGPPGLMTFDASTRETCQVRPVRTNTPLQALNLMNDVIFVEAARKLAERALIEGGKTVESRIRRAFLLVANRPPSESELGILQEALQSYQENFQQDPIAAESLLKIGESKSAEGLNPRDLAAYTTLASLILNLDEAVTRE